MHEGGWAHRVGMDGVEIVSVGVTSVDIVSEADIVLSCRGFLGC